jgi:hypothetical protein
VLYDYNTIVVIGRSGLGQTDHDPEGMTANDLPPDPRSDRRDDPDGLLGWRPAALGAQRVTETRANPPTVPKAYQQLTGEALVEARRGSACSSRRGARDR